MIRSCSKRMGTLLLAMLLATSGRGVVGSEPAPDFLGPVLGGGFCFDCLADNYAQFKALSARFARMRRPVEPERLGDFVVSRVGILIHEDCYQAFGDRLDLEQVVTDTVLTGFQCTIERKREAERRGRHGAPAYVDGGAPYREHIPRLLNLFTRHAPVADAVAWGFAADGSRVRIDLRDPCREYPKLGYAALDLTSDCRFASEVSLGQPKLFCSIDALSAAVTRRHHRSPETSRALATLPQMAYPLFKVWEGRTQVYNAPMITLLPLSHDMEAGVFMSTLWHELMHNIGYEHGSAQYMDPYFCQTSCFWQQHAALWQAPDVRIRADQACMSAAAPDPIQHALARQIGRDFGDE